MSRIDKQRKQLQQQLESATTYDQWYTAAESLDDIEGALDWREAGGTELLHESLIREHIDSMRRLRDQGDTGSLIEVTQESLYRHLGELFNPELYSVARTGTKYLATAFLEEVEAAMHFICDHPIAGVAEEQKLQMFREAERVYGRPALMLSGGAAFGIYHLGVTRALWQQDLLPDVIAGSSMGAIVAAAICNRSSEELDEFFRAPRTVHRQAFQWLSPLQIWRKGYAMDQSQLHHHIRANIGSNSFREAYERSGRVLNISVSPTRTRQKPRLLSQLSSPDVLIDYAVLASCAVPAIYPPVTLKARARNGSPAGHTDYMPTERWMDGSVHGDLPLMRMSRLHNVNKTIVSQANPHVLPFISPHYQRGFKATLKRAAASTAHGQLATALRLTRSTGSPGLLRPIFEQAYAMATQSYLGDITIQFPFRPLLYRKILSNPGAADLEMYIRLGERATWQRMAMIRDHTQLSRTFTKCISKLKHRVGAEREPRSGSPG